MRKGHRRVQCIFNINKRQQRDVEDVGDERHDAIGENKIKINLLKAWNVLTSKRNSEDFCDFFYRFPNNISPLFLTSIELHRDDDVDALF